MDVPNTDDEDDVYRRQRQHHMTPVGYEEGGHAHQAVGHCPDGLRDDVECGPELGRHRLAGENEGDEDEHLAKRRLHSRC